MRIADIVIGAALLVAGAALIAFAPFFTTTGFYRAETQFSESFNSSVAASLVSTYSFYADWGELIAIVGVVLAPVGAAILAYGLTVGKGGEKEKQVPPVAEPVKT